MRSPPERWGPTLLDVALWDVLGGSRGVGSDNSISMSIQPPRRERPRTALALPRPAKGPALDTPLPDAPPPRRRALLPVHRLRLRPTLQGLLPPPRPLPSLKVSQLSPSSPDLPLHADASRPLRKGSQASLYREDPPHLPREAGSSPGSSHCTSQRRGPPPPIPKPRPPRPKASTQCRPLSASRLASDPKSLLAHLPAGSQNLSSIYGTSLFRLQAPEETPVLLTRAG